MMSKALINTDADGASVIEVELTPAGQWIQMDVIGLTTILVRRADILQVLSDEEHG